MSGKIFTEHLGRLCTTINTHGYQPKDILLGTITIQSPKIERVTSVIAETTEELPYAVPFQS